MRYLGLALNAEGGTDYRFLKPVLRRLTEELCLARATEPVEVSDVMELEGASGGDGSSRTAEAVLRAAKDAAVSFNLLFLHRDGGGDPDSVRDEVSRNLGARVSALPGLGSIHVVLVVPVREMEAWPLADGDAIRAAFGTKSGDAALGIPARHRDVEGIPDPKRALDDVCLAAFGGRRSRRRRSAAAYLDAIGERISLERLRLVPAFARLEQDLIQALGDAGVVGG